MKKRPNQLIFISQINRDGSGTTPISESLQKSLSENSLMNAEYYELQQLSISQGTYIASGFNSFVVKLKQSEPKENAGKALVCVNKAMQETNDEDLDINMTAAINSIKSQSIDFLEWTAKNGWELVEVKLSGGEVKSGWVNKSKHILVNGSDWHYLELIKNHGKSSNSLYNMYNTEDNA